MKRNPRDRFVTNPQEAREFARSSRAKALEHERLRQRFGREVRDSKGRVVPSSGRMAGASTRLLAWAQGREVKET